MFFSSPAVDGFVAVRSTCGCSRLIDRAARRAHLLDQRRLHHLDAVVRDRRRDHRHLQRRRQHLVLPEGEPARDRRASSSAVGRRVEELAVRVEARGRARVGRRLERRHRVEAELLRLVEDPLGAELLADVAEDGVDRVLVGLDEVDRAERLGPALVERVRDLLAVLGAVARVVEGRVGLVDAVVERRRGRDRLERRARREEALRGAVQERRRRLGRARALRRLRSSRSRSAVSIRFGSKPGVEAIT